ncbi:MAG TPA: PEP-CTERM sorting domain-containing protein [Terriglobia bacterium]|nr:PEP-CTERM sorting domain-containing protein [Terriglobia bacterium]
MTTPGDFSNAGSVMVGKNSTLTIGSGGANNYTQSGGASLKVNGSLTAAIAFINGGTLSGSGTIVANVNNSGGIVTASDPGSPDILTMHSSYAQGAGGTLEAFLGGVAAGTGYSQLDVTGTATLGGTLDVDLATGSNFTPAAGEGFFVLLANNGVNGMFSGVDFADAPLPSGDTWSVVYNPNNVELEVNGPTTATPEPSGLLLFGTALAMAAFLGMRKVVTAS